MLFYTSCASKATVNRLTESEKIAQENLKNVALENQNLKDSISKLND